MSRTSTPRKPEFYVYALLDPRKPYSVPVRFARFLMSHEPFYIGKGKGGRVHHHALNCKASYNSHKDSKIRNIHSAGLKVVEVILRSNLTERRALNLEVQLIARIGRANSQTGPLTNRTDGGEGASNRWMSRSARERRSKLSKQWHASLSPDRKREIFDKILLTNSSKSEAEKKKIGARKSKALKKQYARASARWKKEKSQSNSAGQLNRDPALREQTSKQISDTLKRRWAELPHSVKMRKTKHLRNIPASVERKRVSKISSAWWSRTEEERAEINSRRNASIRAAKAMKIHTHKEHIVG